MDGLLWYKAYETFKKGWIWIWANGLDSEKESSGEDRINDGTYSHGLLGHRYRTGGKRDA